MCGIAGYLGNWPPSMLDEMVAAIRHRGPDGEGIWSSEAGEIGLGHRRLAIIDRTNGGAQPMASCGARYRTIFNGEIYNFRSLSAELTRRGYELNEKSDTAVLGPLYDLAGPAMLERLNGIFSFVIWDDVARRLFAARDAFGVKPFYYAETSCGLVFASELKAFRSVAEIDRSIDRRALCDYLTHLWSPGARTMFAGVKKLPPGHYMVVDPGKPLEIRRWHFPSSIRGPRDVDVCDQDSAKKQLLALFDLVVADQCVSDAPIGAFLSGGVDSSAIVAAMCATGNRPVKTYCIGYEGPGIAEEGFGDDLAFAEDFAASLGVPFEPIIVKPMQIDDLERLAYMLDEPQADPAPLYVEAIATVARDDGVKVLMSGAGGDDIFSGYRRHAAAALRASNGFVARPAGQIATFASRFSRGPLKRRLEKLGYMLAGSDDEFLMRAFDFSPRAEAVACLSDFVASSDLKSEKNSLEAALERTVGAHLVDRMLAMELAGFLPDHNLNYTDKASMAAGVEVRVPFLDERLVAFAGRLPPGLKVRRGAPKWLLREALRGRVPNAVLDRKKTGFGAPVRLWLSGPLRSVIEDILLSQSFRQRGLFDLAEVRRLFEDTLSGRRDGAYLVLAIVMAELWLRKFHDVSAPRAVA